MADDEIPFRYDSKQDDRAKADMPPGLPQEIDMLCAAIQRFEVAARKVVAGQMGARLQVSTSLDGTVVIAYVAMLVKSEPAFAMDTVKEATATLLGPLL